MTTRDEIMTMDEDALRLAVAKRCWYDVVEKRKDGAWLAFHDLAGYNMRGIEGVPDYPRDIVAAYALEDALPVERREAYAYVLHQIICQQTGYSVLSTWNLTHASASDRCRAWLLTMEG